MCEAYNGGSSLRLFSFMSSTHLLTLEDQRYPPILREIPSPPKRLYVMGNLEVLHRPMLAVVGTRQPSPYGLHVTPSLLKPVVQAGITIVSGLALGIDGCAHRVAVDLGAPTVAVLGCGLDRIYPWQHQHLADDILRTGGMIMSEFPPGTPPLRHHFPQRNRILSGLSRAVLLVEAGETSGALITAKFAVDQNRDVLVVPGPITSPQSVGPLNWLKLGATPVTTANDILTVFSVATEPHTPSPALPPLHDPIERHIVSQLRSGPLHIDSVAESCRLDTSVVSAALSLLELRGYVHHDGGMVYRLNT